jgi:hypothetical protein
MLSIQTTIHESPALIPSQLQEVLKIIASESTRIECMLRLRKNGLNSIFAPDFSEIFGYLNPLGTSRKINNSYIRNWYSFKALIQSKEELVILPPYVNELNNKINVLRYELSTSRLAELYSGINSQDLKTRLEDTDMASILDDIQKDIEKSTIDKYADFNSIIQKYRAELGLIYDFVMQKDIFQTLKDLILNERIQLTSKKMPFLMDDIQETLTRQPSKWFYELQKVRSSPQSASSNLHDSKALDILFEINRFAVNHYQDCPFVFFVSRSLAIDKVARKDFVFEMPGVGPLYTLWSPETYLAYHLVQEACDDDVEKMYSILNKATSLAENWL